MVKHCSSVPDGDMIWGGRPSMGVTLLFATFGFGADRFYVGQAGIGIALLIAYLTVFGSAIAVPIEWLSSLSLVFSILMNNRTAFMYGSTVIFEQPTMFDKVMAVIWIILMLLFIALLITSIAIVDLHGRAAVVHP